MLGRGTVNRDPPLSRFLREWVFMKWARALVCLSLHTSASPAFCLESTQHMALPRSETHASIRPRASFSIRSHNKAEVLVRTNHKIMTTPRAPMARVRLRMRGLTLSTYWSNLLKTAFSIAQDHMATLEDMAVLPRDLQSQPCGPTSSGVQSQPLSG